MALPDYAKYSVGTTIVVADTTDHSPSAAANFGTRTHQIDCTDLVAATARESAKLDFGANRDLEYAFGACIDWETNPEIAAGETVEFYMGWSPNETAATANPASLSGADADYTGYSGGSLAQSLLALDYIGSMVMDNVINSDETQIDSAIGIVVPRMRYGILVVYNNAASAAFHSSMENTSFFFLPLVTGIHDS